MISTSKALGIEPILAHDYNSPWFVITSNNQRQAQAKLYLEKLGYTVFLPRYREAEVIGAFGRKTLAETPLFGNYMFIHADLREGEHFHAVRNCPGVGGLLGGACPQPVAPKAMAALFTALGEDGLLDRVATLAALAKYGRDEELLIIEGPFAGFVGKCLQSRGERITLFLSLFGAEKRVSLRSDQVRRAIAPSEKMSSTSGAARRRMRKTVRQLQQDAGYDHIVKGGYA